MKDIARDLGVSVGAVSKALRNDPDIGQATKDRVLKRMKELNYRPNLMARALVTGRSSIVALVVPDLMSTFFSEIAIYMSMELRKQGYSMLISWTEEDPEIQANEIEHLLSIGIDAMVIATSGNDTKSFRRLKERNVPYLLLDREVAGLKAPYVGGDDVLFGRMATEHLIAEGCKRIGHISGPPMSPGFGRLEGYKRALKSASIRINEDYIVSPAEPGPRTFHHGFESAQRLLAVKPRVDGIFCFNDPLAIGAMEAVLAAGLRIPQDIAIIGCGNHPLGATLRNPVSSIDQNTKEIGEKAATQVLCILQNNSKSTPDRMTLVKPRLLVRASSNRAAFKSTDRNAGNQISSNGKSPKAPLRQAEI
jgi:LacI family transcriptional regulator